MVFVPIEMPLQFSYEIEFLFKYYSLSTCCVSGAVLDMRSSEENRQFLLSLMGLSIL